MAEQEERLLMLIDDEPAQSRLVTALAAREGWRTVVANDAETAIATLGTRQGMQLSAIILDQWVPGDAACDLIAELKQRRPALPILMLTTSASPLLAVEAMRAGATDYLIKPVAPERLMRALRAATTARRRASRPLRCLRWWRRSRRTLIPAPRTPPADLAPRWRSFLSVRE